MRKKTAVIVSATRTAVGNFGGSLQSLSAVDMGKTVASEAIHRAKVQPSHIDEVITGCVLQAGIGQNVARQVSLGVSIPESVPSMTINQVCGSGLKSVILAMQSIQLGEANVVLAGGTESMSNAPYLLDGARFGYRLGNGNLYDTVVNDGLTDVFNHYHMGITAENLVEKYDISRLEQDEFSAESQNRAEKAIKNGAFIEEITPVPIKHKNDKVIIDQDEFPRFGTTVESLAKLRPAFKKDGTVTAGNASGINDGAAMLVIAEKEYAMNRNLPILAEIIGHATVGCDPKIMGIGPVKSTQMALKKSGLTVSDLDVIEANEAFAAQVLAVTRELKWDLSKVNVHGGAIALGHPIGASGARILTTLVHIMRKKNGEFGLATLCVGGGMGISVVIKSFEN